MLAVGFLLILHWLSLRYIKRRAMRFANFKAMERFTGERIISRNYVTVVLRVLTLLFLVLSISGMVVRYRGHSSESDFVLVVDASGSMLARDYEPDRISAAKDAARLFLESLPEGSNAGIVSFAGITFVRQVPTNDLDKAKEAVDGISVEAVGGTAIGDAIVSSANLLAGSNRAKTIVLLTDGQNNVGIGITEALLYAKQNGIKVDTIGMGTEEGGTFENITFVSRLDTEALEYMANETGGVFFRAENKSELSGIYSDLATSSEQILTFDASSSLLLIALLFFFMEWFLTNTKYRTLP